MLRDNESPDHSKKKHRLFTSNILLTHCPTLDPAGVPDRSAEKKEKQHNATTVCKQQKVQNRASVHNTSQGFSQTLTTTTQI
jgi:hypothetical protein